MGLKKRTRLLFAACYGAALLWWLASSLFCLWYDGAQPAITLVPEGAALVQLEKSGYIYVSTGTDPQLVYEGVDTGLRRVVLYAEFETPPGEMALYYTRKPGQGFAAGRRVFGTRQQDGSYEYLLPPGRVYSLRVDPGTAAGNHMVLLGLELNAGQPAGAYFAPGWKGGLGLALLPALAAAGVYTIIEAIGLFRKKRGAK